MKTGNSELEKWKPGVPKAILLLIAGAIWIGIGIMLNSLSFSWLKNEQPVRAVILTIAGFVFAIIIHHFGFARIVDKNLNRILPMEGKRCLFSFIPWRSYILISIMIIFGSFLRHSSIPRLYLAPLYTSIGTALIISGFGYIRALIRLITKK